MKKPPAGGNKSDGPFGSQRSRDLDVFSRAVSLFNAGKFDEAKQLFDQLAKIPDASLADSARSRARMCERRLGPS
jgi:hypothetical protein